MYKKIWEDCHESVCAINFFSSNGIRITSVSGFKYGKFIITDEMVYKVDKATDIQICFMQPDGCTIKASVKITERDFKLRMIKGMRENIAGFALFQIDFPQFDAIPSLNLNLSKKIVVGSKIAVIGYSAENGNISIKKGIISSYCKHKNAKYLQFDAALELGNSGSPLIDTETGEVVGLVGNRLASVIENHKRILDIINNNLAMLKISEGKMLLNDIDLIQVLIANQNQVKHLAQEFFKNSSSIYGFAIEISHVFDYFDVETESNKIAKVTVE